MACDEQADGHPPLLLFVHNTAVKRVESTAKRLPHFAQHDKLHQNSFRQFLVDVTVRRFGQSLYLSLSVPVSTVDVDNIEGQQ